MHISITASIRLTKTILETLQLTQVKSQKASKGSIAIVETATNQSILLL